MQPRERNLLGQKSLRKLQQTTLMLILLFYFSKQLSISALFWNWKNILKQNYACSACNCNLLQTCFSMLCWRVPKPWQIKFLVMYVQYLFFTLFFLLTCFHIKIVLCAFLVNTNHFVKSILSRLDDFAINAVAKLFVDERLRSQRCIQNNPVKHLRWSFLQI